MPWVELHLSRSRSQNRLAQVAENGAKYAGMTLFSPLKFGVFNKVTAKKMEERILVALFL